MKIKQILTGVLSVLIIFGQSSCEKRPDVSKDYGSIVDYFKEEFDNNRNCADEEKIAKLRQNYPDQCVSFSTTEYNQESAFRSCMEQVRTKIAVQKCKFLTIKSSGNITYCMQRGISECCVSPPVKCYKTPDRSDRGRDEASTQYVKYGLDTMADFVATIFKYKACFKTQAMDSTDICEAECRKLKNSEFAKKCSKKVDGHIGIFKCCIITENRGCDICKYCCILPVCTRIKYGQNSDEFDTETMTKTNVTNKKLPDEQKIIEAKFRYNDNDSNNYFCVPKKFKKGKDFYYYDMEEYRAVNNIKEMKNLDKSIYTWDKHYYRDLRFNPKYRLMFTNETGLKNFAETFGHEYCFKLYKDTKGKRSKCEKQCKKLEKETFAKECNKKKDSLFKCCTTPLNLHEDNEIAQIKTMKTLNETLKRPCRNGKCYYCCLESFCSTFKNGKINQTLRRDYMSVIDNCQNKEGHGKDYVGKVNKTKTGLTCQKWTSQSPHKHNFFLLGKNNYCRNPNGRPGVWCYTTSAKKWELCDVPVCGDDESEEPASKDDENEEDGSDDKFNVWSDPMLSPVGECMNTNNNFPEYWPQYNNTEYIEAYTEDMMCRVSLQKRVDWNPSNKRIKIPTKQKINKKCDRKKKKRNKRKHREKKYKNKNNKNKQNKKKNKKNKKKKENKRKRNI